MQKVIVIGCPGAGKSTFARRLRDVTGLPLHYLDMIWHRPDRSTVSREEFDACLGGLLQGERWILDGNYIRTLGMRLASCDAVFFLDYPQELCLAGAAARVGKPREDLPWLEESLDEEFAAWIAAFAEEQRPRILALLQEYGAGREVFVFHSRDEAAQWLARFQKSPAGGK